MLAKVVRPFTDQKLGKLTANQVVDINLDRYKVLRERGLLTLPDSGKTSKPVAEISPRVDWIGKPCVIIASGPSLTKSDCQLVEDSRRADKIRVIAVNDNWRRAPNADIIYAADYRWWRHYHAEVKDQAPFAEHWTQDYNASVQFGLDFIMGVNQPGLSLDPKRIHTGSNSGYQAIGLAFHLGAPEILLLGFDMSWTGKKAHWFGDHPQELSNPKNLPEIVPKFKQLARDLEANECQVINCSKKTAIEGFVRSTISEQLPA